MSAPGMLDDPATTDPRPVLRVMVTGGRGYADRHAVYRALDELSAATDDEPLGSVRLVVMHGDCPTGADYFADDWCIVNWTVPLRFPADWNDITALGAVVKKRRDGTRYNAAAGPCRNMRMVVEGKPDVCLAFPGGRGTENAIRCCENAGVKVRRFT